MTTHELFSVGDKVTWREQDDLFNEQTVKMFKNSFKEGPFEVTHTFEYGEFGLLPLLPLHPQIVYIQVLNVDMFKFFSLPFSGHLLTHVKD